jgi:ATP-binding protein involved in chromosome partitioning
VPFLGSVPLDPQVRLGGDTGRPVVVDHAASPAATALMQIAQKVAARVSIVSHSQQPDIPLQVVG